jgi:hypothetical protein
MGTYYTYREIFTEKVDDVSERKIILKTILIFQYQKCRVNENSEWLFERHKPIL